MLGGDGGEDDDEGAGRPGDLDAAAAEQRHHQGGDDGGVDALLGLDPRGDGEGHGQGQRHHADDDAGDDVAQPLVTAEQAGFCRFHDRDHAPDLRLQYAQYINMLCAYQSHFMSLQARRRTPLRSGGHSIEGTCR